MKLIHLAKDKRVFEFNNNEEDVAVNAEIGDFVNFLTEDAHNGTIDKSELFADVDFPELNPENANPATGLVKVKNSKPGYYLKVKVLEINPAARGILPVRSYMGVLRDVVEDKKARIVKYENDSVWINQKLQISARPMIGTIGVAAQQEKHSATMYPGSHGGNLDNNMIRESSVVYLPVYQEGAYLGVGDVHAAMGDGELTCAGIDIQASVTIKVEGCSTEIITKNPVVKTQDHIVTHGIGYDYSSAAAQATKDMQSILNQSFNISDYETYLMLGSRGDLGLCQACNSDSLPMVVRLAYPLDGQKREVKL